MSDPDYDYKFYQQYFVDISAAWHQDNILLGTNGIAALTFADVPIAPKAP